MADELVVGGGIGALGGGVVAELTDDPLEDGGDEGAVEGVEVGVEGPPAVELAVDVAVVGVGFPVGGGAVGVEAVGDDGDAAVPQLLRQPEDLVQDGGFVVGVDATDAGVAHGSAQDAGLFHADHPRAESTADGGEGDEVAGQEGVTFGFGFVHDGAVAEPVGGVGGERLMGERAGLLGLHRHGDELGVDAVQRDPEPGGGGAELLVRQAGHVEGEGLGDGVVVHGVEQHGLTVVERVFDVNPYVLRLKRFCSSVENGRERHR